MNDDWNKTIGGDPPWERKDESISQSKYSTYLLTSGSEQLMIPMPGKIIVKQDGSTEKRGSILVSEKFAEKDRPMTGVVLAVGPGKPCELSDDDIIIRVNDAVIADLKSPKPIGALSLTGKPIIDAIKEIRSIERQSRPVSVKAGDRVVFRVFAGEGIEWTDGSMCRCVTEDDLLAVILE